MQLLVLSLSLFTNDSIFPNDQKVNVAAMLPSAAMSAVENDAIGSIAQEVENKLKLAIDVV